VIIVNGYFQVAGKLPGSTWSISQCSLSRLNKNFYNVYRVGSCY
jgi:hypothetical protein